LGALRDVPRKAPTTLKGEVAALLTSGVVGSLGLILDDKDVVLLLKAAVEKEGSNKRFCQTPRSRANKSEQHIEWKTTSEQFPRKSFGASQRLHSLISEARRFPPPWSVESHARGGGGLGALIQRTAGSKAV
jgi:hypothetical protein